MSRPIPTYERIRPVNAFVQIPPVCTEVGLRDFLKSAALIDEAHQQTVRVLAGEECSTCDHSQTGREKGEAHRSGTGRTQAQTNVA